MTVPDATSAGPTTAMPDGFTRVASLDALAPGQLLGVRVSRAMLCLARLGDDVFALDDRCPHADFPLSKGDLLPNGTVECAWHGAQFDCRTGAVCRGPATDAASTHDVLLHDGDVYVRLRR